MTTTTPYSSVTPESPWLGLRSFTEETQAFFFGRGEELADLYERTLDKPLTILFGQSGLGKSSLLQAALVPRLRSEGFLPVFVRFDHESNAATLEHQLLSSLRDALQSAGNSHHVATLNNAILEGRGIQDHSAFLWLLFHDPAYHFIPPHGAPPYGFPRIIFLLDQFEEIFTLGERPSRRSASTAFRETLASLVENRPPAGLRAILEQDESLAERVDYRARHARVLLSLREDFLHRLERWRRSMPSLMDNRLELRILSGPQALLAVVRPGKLRSGMPAIITDQVGQAIVRFVAGAGDDVPLNEIDAVPPLVSLVCAELNAQRLDAGQNQITRAQFEGHGSDILASFYVRSFDIATYGSALDSVPGVGAALTDLRRIIEDRLLSPDGFRESVAFDTIARELARVAPTDSSKTLLDSIVERRLLTVEERGGVRRLELAHDVLTRIVKASRDERHEVEAISNARSEQAHAEAETVRILKERNRLRRLAILASCLAIIAAGGAIVGLLGYKRAVDERNRAVNAEQEAVASTARADQSRRDAEDGRNRAVNAEREAVESTARAEKSRREAEAASRQVAEALKKAKYAGEQMLRATNEAQTGFESAWKGLTDLYDDYATGTLENTPGISGGQANRLKSKLRGHLLIQLRELNRVHPDHRGTVHYIARLLLDESRESSADADYTRARENLDEAFQWTSKRLPDEASEAELYADMLLEQTRLAYVDDPKKGADVAATSMSSVKGLASKWSNSWRIGFVLIRLENFRILPGTSNRLEYAKLAERLVPLIEKSAKHFDPVLWYFTLQANGCFERGAFNRDLADYALLRKHTIWLREHLVQGNSYTLVQLEEVARRFQDLLQFITLQFTQANDNNTANERHAILDELESTMKALESRLSKSSVVYGTRGDLLRLEEMSVRNGIYTQPARDLQSAIERHRMAAAALGVASSVADLFAPAFKSYAAENADAASKTSSLATVENSLRHFMSLDLVGVDTVLRNIDIASAVEMVREKDPDDPLLKLHRQMVEQYVRLYQSASRDAKSALIDTFAAASVAEIESWFASGNHEKVVDLWRRCFEVQPIATFVSGDKQPVVQILSRCIISLFRTGNHREAERLLNDTSMMCDTILAGRPWDFFLQDAFIGLCFAASAELAKMGEQKSTQQLLRRGWRLFLRRCDREFYLNRYANLPIKGGVPENARPDDARYFSSFTENWPPTDQEGSGTRKFSIPCIFNGTRARLNVCLYGGPNGYAMFLDQVRCISEYRGGSVPPEIQDRFKRLENVARENKTEFMKMCSRALNATGESSPAQLSLDATIEELEKSKALYFRAKSEVNRGRLAQAYANVSDAAFYLERWSDAEKWARKSIEIFDFPVARNNLATALLFQGELEAAIEIYRALWNDRVTGEGSKSAARNDLDALEKSGIKHPLVARVKAELESSIATPKLSKDKP